MATLGPAVDFSVQSSGEQQAPSALQNLSGLLSTGLEIGLSTRMPQQGTELSASERSAQADESLYREFGRQLGRAQDLRLAGKADEALRLESRVSAEFIARGGDLQDARAQDMITIMTGRPNGSLLGMSEEQVMLQQIMETPEYQTAYLSTYATNPDAQDSERSELALRSLSLQSANEAMMEAAQFDWSAGGEQAFGNYISNFENTLNGGIALAQQRDGEIRLEDIQEARLQYREFRADIYARRPSNLDNAEWQPVQDRLDAIDENLKYWEGLVGVDNIKAQTILDINRAVQSSPDGTPLERSIIGLMMMDDPSLVGTLGILAPSEIRGVLDATMRESTLTPTQVRNPTRWVEPRRNEDGVTVDPRTVFLDASQQLRIANGAGKNLSNNVDLRNSWGELVITGLSNIRQLGQSGEWLTADQYNGMFNDNFFNNLEEIRAVDPELYSALTTRTQEVLTMTSNSLAARVGSIQRTTGLVYQPSTGIFSVTRESAQAVMDSTAPGVFRDGKTMFEILDAGVEEFYGGNYAALYADGGARFNDASGAEDELVASILQYTPFLKPVPETTKQLMTSITSITDLQARLSTGMTEAERVGTTAVDTVLSAPRQAVNPGNIETTTLPPAGQNGDPNVDGGSANDTLNTNAATGLISLVDRTEGGGNYDTLFGHSQRSGGRFSNVRVSEMTLGELREFSGARGEGSYGAWVRANNPKGALATPMGRYQFVGTTLFALADKLGLPDDTVFTPQVQDALFLYKVNERLEGETTQEGRRRALRAEWDGFNTASDEELDSAINAYLSGDPVDLQGIVLTQPGRRAPDSSIIPVPAPEDRRVGIAASRGDAPATSPRPQARGDLQAPDNTGNTGTNQNTGNTSSSNVQSASRVATEELDATAIARLESSGIQKYSDEAALEEAINGGKVTAGSLVIVGNKAVYYEG